MRSVSILASILVGGIFTCQAVCAQQQAIESSNTIIKPPVELGASEQQNAQNFSENLIGSAVYRSLNKDWLYFSLYQMSDVISKKEQGDYYSRLEFTVLSKRFSQRKFRRFWLDTVVVEHGTDLLREKGEEFDQFFSVLKKSLKQGDLLALEQQAVGTAQEHTLFSINYQPMVRLDPSFLPLLAQSLLGTHPPSLNFKQYLLGLKADQSLEIAQYQQLKPSLSRISQTKSWSDIAAPKPNQITASTTDNVKKLTPAVVVEPPQAATIAVPAEIIDSNKPGVIADEG